MKENPQLVKELQASPLVGTSFELKKVLEEAATAVGYINADIANRRIYCAAMMVAALTHSAILRSMIPMRDLDAFDNACESCYSTIRELVKEKPSDTKAIIAYIRAGVSV